MQLPLTAFAATAALAISSTFAMAGAPNTPGEKGDLIAESKADRQADAGHPSGWGQRVSDRANGTMDNPYGNLGGYLKSRASGPNAKNDNGKGND